MSVAPTTASSSADIYSQLGISQHVANAALPNNDLGFDSYLRLMTEQMQNQDPTKPMDSSAFLAQLAQFSSVKGLQTLDTRMQGMMQMLGEQQAVQVAGLVGHNAYIKTDTATLSSGGTIEGSVNATAAGTITIQVKGSDGSIIREFTVEATGAGSTDFSWDGLDSHGLPAQAGKYTVSAQTGQGSLDMNLAARINSISFTAQGIVFNLEGHEGLTFDQLLRIG
jgi:flagellar basal-body rod modification protein FlgD